MSTIKVKKIRSLDPIERSSSGSSTTIGRADDNDVVLRNTAVSRHHALIETVDGRTRVRDLGSRHGVRVNGVVVEQAADLCNGDEIGIGPFVLTIDDQTLPNREAPIASNAAGQMAELDEQRRDLERRERELQQQLTARQDADAEQAAMTERLEQLQRELQEAVAERDRSASHLQDVQASLADRIARIAELETHCKSLATERDGLNGDLKSQRHRAEKLATRLEARTKQVEQTAADVRQLRRHLEQMEASARTAQQRAAGAETGIRRLEIAVHQLLEISRGVSSMNRAMRALETLWVETNEWVEQAAEGDPAVLEQAVQQRDSVSARLEAAHAERDSAIEDLQTLVESLGREAAAEQMRRAELSQPMTMPITLETESRKRWKLFGS